MESTADLPVHNSELLISFPSGTSKSGNVNQVHMALLDSGATSNLIDASLIYSIDAIITSTSPV